MDIYFYVTAVLSSWLVKVIGYAADKLNTKVMILFASHQCQEYSFLVSPIDLVNLQLRNFHEKVRPIDHFRVLVQVVIYFRLAVIARYRSKDAIALAIQKWPERPYTILSFSDALLSFTLIYIKASLYPQKFRYTFKERNA